MTVPQTTYSMDPPIGKIGMLYRTPRNTAEFGALPALENIQPGDLLEKVVDGNGVAGVRAAQSANGALKSIAGVAVYKAMRAPRQVGDANSVTGFAIGEMVSYVKKGKIFAKWLSTDGSTAQVAFTAPNYAHSTTLTAERGAFTDKAVASTSTHEVDACPTGIQLAKDVTYNLGFGVCLVELNLP